LNQLYGYMELSLAKRRRRLDRQVVLDGVLHDASKPSQVTLTVVCTGNSDMDVMVMQSAEENM
jgi:hypothetical protein